MKPCLIALLLLCGCATPKVGAIRESAVFGHLEMQEALRNGGIHTVEFRDKLYSVPSVQDAKAFKPTLKWNLVGEDYDCDDIVIDAAAQFIRLHSGRHGVPVGIIYSYGTEHAVLGIVCSDRTLYFADYATGDFLPMREAFRRGYVAEPIKAFGF
jgi:hypothetical protein